MEPFGSSPRAKQRKNNASNMKKEKAKTSAQSSSGFVFTVVEEQGDEVIIEVSPEDYEREKAAGVEEEALLKPGRHKFIRGGFLKRHGVTPEEVKQWPVTVEVQTRLDLKQVGHDFEGLS